MLNIHDIIGMCACNEEEIAAVALHENVPDAVASEMANYLIHSDDGVPKLRKIIVEDIAMATKEGNIKQIDRLNEVLKHFIVNHPEYSATTTA